jgi:hypothetical protein
MTLLELHPDELLLREASSTLTPREWADLSAHLERCPACALERAVRREAARVRAPSDLDHAIAARVVGRLLAGQDRELAPARPGRPWKRRLAYAALVLVLVSGTATAGVALVAQIRQRDAARVEPEKRRAPPARIASRRYRSAPAPVARAGEGEVEPSLTPPGPVPAVIEPAPPTRETGPVGPTAVARPETGGGRPMTGNRSRSLPGRASPERPAADAAALFNQAEAAASAGRIAGASGLYGELGRRFPGTREEIVARALHGQLLLDGLANPARALALFEGYLAAEPTGTLAEEARLGRARALERLGRSSQERSAWLELLRAHPRSVHAAAARARLAALDAQ